MSKIKINNTDLKVFPINLGGNAFGWTLDEKGSFEILDGFVANGGNFIDTADSYPWWINGTGGLSEEIIGKWMNKRGNRKNIIVATKTGSENKNHGFDISKEHVAKSIDESLKRLQTDYIDLFYTHFDDDKTPVEDTLSAYDDAIKAGKIRYIAVSNLSPERITASFEAAEKNNLPKYVALQPHYNLVERETYENDYLPLVEKYGLTVFPYYALASGFLSGKYRSEADFGKSARGSGVKGYLNEEGLAVLDALDKVSAKHNTSQAAVSLAWLLAQPHIVAPISSATKQSHLDTMFEAVKINLDSEDLELLDSASE